MMRILYRAVLVLVITAWSAAAPAQSPKRDFDIKNAASQEGRVALVIGNSSYKDVPLANPVNDASDMANALQNFGFKVTLKRNAGTREMRQAIREFGAELRRAQVGLFYFAGHGIQIKGNNYLVPVGADIQSEADAEDLSLDANYVLRTMEDSQVKISIVVLDACRNNPFARSFRSLSTGLAQMNAATGSIVAFATAPGSVAADGAGRNGLYTKHLLESLRQPDTDILKVFQHTRAGVVTETRGRQTPWESTSLVGDFYFKPAQGQLAGPSRIEGGTASKDEKTAVELLFWQSIRETGTRADYLAYLDRYPSGEFAALAKTHADRLQEELVSLVASQVHSSATTPPAKTASGFPALSSAAAMSLKDKASQAQIDELLRGYRRDAEAGDAIAQYS